jgi:hypothetical protein
MDDIEKMYIESLNETMGLDYEDENWIIGGENRAPEWYGSYGLALKKYDPIAFQVGLNEYELENEL